MGEKKVLTMLLGSPRKEGNSETLADALAAGAAEKGTAWLEAAKELGGNL